MRHLRWSILVAVPLGLIVVPLIVVVSVFSAWSMTAALAAGAIAGAIGVRRSGEARVELTAAALRGIGVVLVAFGVAGWIFSGSRLTGLAGMVAFASWWLPLGMLPAMAAARLLLARRPPRASLLAIVATLVLFGGGWALAFVRSPAAVAEKPRAAADSVAYGLYSLCWMTADRRRIGAIERITALDVRRGRITCEYYTWGGIKLGEVRHGTWYPGAMP